MSVATPSQLCQPKKKKTKKAKTTTTTTLTPDIARCPLGAKPPLFESHCFKEIAAGNRKPFNDFKHRKEYRHDQICFSNEWSNAEVDCREGGRQGGKRTRPTKDLVLDEEGEHVTKGNSSGDRKTGYECRLQQS